MTFISGLITSIPFKFAGDVPMSKLLIGMESLHEADLTIEIIPDWVLRYVHLRRLCLAEFRQEQLEDLKRKYLPRAPLQHLPFSSSVYKPRPRHIIRNDASLFSCFRTPTHQLHLRNRPNGTRYRSAVGHCAERRACYSRPSGPHAELPESTMPF